MSTQTYDFYIADVIFDKNTNEYIVIDGTEKNIEKDFNIYNDDGNAKVHYLKCEGLEDVGETRVYTENYADSDRTRVYIPKKETNEQTNVKLTLLFSGKYRREAFNLFNEAIRRSIHAYWDTARNKKLIFYVKEATKPSDDIYKGSTPYIQCTYTLTNVYGKTTNINV